MSNGDNTQQLLVFAAIGLLAYWYFSKTESFQGNGSCQEYANVPHVHLTEEESQMLHVKPPPPEEVPQYAKAFTI
jgi:hypothetical protein